MRTLSTLAFLLLFSFLFSFKVSAQAPSETYHKATVIEVVSEGKVIDKNRSNLFQDIKVRTDQGKVLNVHLGDPNTLTADGKVAIGDNIVILQQSVNKKSTYQVYDKYRFDSVLIIIGFFIILIIVTAGMRGVGSIVGLATSLAVILFFIVPQILAGRDPLLISTIGSLIILFVSTYVAHGVSKKTTAALISTFIALFITVGIAILFTSFSKLSGTGDDDVASLKMGATSIINLRGLFLSGVIIGTLGALNDITITQASTIFELAKADRGVKFNQLIKNGFSIGKDHILSLVNTLILAYAGTSLFIFIFLILNPAKVPYWVILNSETISGEIIATIAGSSGLILAVPISTLLAAYIVLNHKNKV